MDPESSSGEHAAHFIPPITSPATVHEQVQRPVNPGEFFKQLTARSAQFSSTSLSTELSNPKPSNTVKVYVPPITSPSFPRITIVKPGTASLPFKIPTSQNIAFETPCKKLCTGLDTEVDELDLDNMGQPQRNNRRKNKSKRNGGNTPVIGESDGSETESINSGEQLHIEKPSLAPAAGVNFEEWVKVSLGQLMNNSSILLTTMLGDEKAKKEGVVTRLATVEEEIYGSKKRGGKKGLTQRVTDLEKSVTNTGKSTVTTKTSIDPGVAKEIENLRTSNEFLVGAASKMQREHKSLQNLLYIQQDRSNYLNLHLGGVAEIPDSSCKTEAVAFFNDILGIQNVSEQDFVKANRKTKPNEYTEDVSDGDHFMKLKVKAPGIMFVRMASESLRELAVQKARGLGGRRHPTLNHKYFVFEIKCEAVRASRERHQPRIKTILNKNEKQGTNDSFHFFGQQFFVNGKLQKDKIQVPTFEEINYSLVHEQDILEKIDLYEMQEPLVKDGNLFYTFAVNSARLDVIRWAYIKVYAKFPDAAHVMMAYKLSKCQGNCDDDEHKGGYTVLRSIQKKKARNIAVFIVGKFTDQQHRLGPKRFQLFTTEADSMIDFVQGSASRNHDDEIPKASQEILDSFKGSQDPSSQEST